MRNDIANPLTKGSIIRYQWRILVEMDSSLFDAYYSQPLRYYWWANDPLNWVCE